MVLISLRQNNGEFSIPV